MIFDIILSVTMAITDFSEAHLFYCLGGKYGRTCGNFVGNPPGARRPPPCPKADPRDDVSPCGD
jgi:hypothetical protein